jgi:hypothetical protein
MEEKNVFEEFTDIIDKIYGVYLDSKTGFVQNKVLIEKTQKETIRKGQATQKYLDSCFMIYGIGDPNIKTSYPLHRCTQMEYKLRNSEEGLNSTVLGQLCIVLVYQYWEDFYRNKIAQIFKWEKNQIPSEIFSDLRIFRKSIIHHRGIALKEIEKCKKFNWFKEGQEIQFSSNQIEEIIRKIKMELLSFANLYALLQNKINKNEA